MTDSDSIPERQLAGPPWYGPEGLALLARMLEREGFPDTEQPHWQVWYQRQAITHSVDQRLRVPWDLACVTVTCGVERGEYDPDAVGAPGHLPGEGTLADQLAALSLFSLETGHLLHTDVRIVNRTPDIEAAPPNPAFRKQRLPRYTLKEKLIAAWEIGAEGYAVQEWIATGAKATQGGTVRAALRLVRVTEDGMEEVAVFPDVRGKQLTPVRPAGR